MLDMSVADLLDLRNIGAGSIGHVIEKASEVSADEKIARLEARVEALEKEKEKDHEDTDR
jgi:hypothetical protein